MQVILSYRCLLLLCLVILAESHLSTTCIIGAVKFDLRFWCDSWTKIRTIIMWKSDSESYQKPLLWPSLMTLEWIHKCDWENMSFRDPKVSTQHNNPTKTYIYVNASSGFLESVTVPKLWNSIDALHTITTIIWINLRSVIKLFRGFYNLWIIPTISEKLPKLS